MRTCCTSPLKWDIPAPIRVSSIILRRWWSARLLYRCCKPCRTHRSCRVHGDNPLVGPVIYRPTGLQRRRQRIGAVSLLLLAGCFQLRIYFAHGDTRSLAANEIIWVLPFVLLCLFCVGFSMFAQTVVDQDGIRTQGLRRHRAEWRNVRSIDVMEQSGKASTSWVVRVVPVSGKAFKLTAPFDSTNGSDPEFHVKVEQIKERWQATAGLGSQT